MTRDRWPGQWHVAVKLKTRQTRGRGRVEEISPARRRSASRFGPPLFLIADRLPTKTEPIESKSDGKRWQLRSLESPTSGRRRRGRGNQNVMDRPRSDIPVRSGSAGGPSHLASYKAHALGSSTGRNGHFSRSVFQRMSDRYEHRTETWRAVTDASVTRTRVPIGDA